MNRNIVISFQIIQSLSSHYKNIAGNPFTMTHITGLSETKLGSKHKHGDFKIESYKLIRNDFSSDITDYGNAYYIHEDVQLLRKKKKMIIRSNCL